MYLYGAKKTDERFQRIYFYPLKTLIGFEEDPNGEYKEILSYYEPLPEEDVEHYNLEFLGTDEPSECESCKISFEEADR